MHVVLTTNFSPWSRYCGGAQRSTHFLACALAQRGSRVTVVFTKPPWESVAVPKGLPYQIEWAALPALASRRSASLRVLTAVSVARRVRTLVRGQTGCVVHAQGEEGALLSRAVACPVVLTTRYPEYPLAPLLAGSSRFTRAWRSLRHSKYAALAAAAHGASAVCATSRASAEMTERALRIEHGSLHVIPNGVDETFFTARRCADAPRGPLVFYGRIERSKGIDVLVEAFARIADRQRTLTIVGAGGELSWLRRRLRELDIDQRVTICAWESAPQLTSRLERAALAVLPSREESFGNAMVEAMAAAAPLVSTAAGSISEVVVDGSTARLVQPGDVHALAAAIDSLLSRPAQAEALGRAGRAHVREHYAWSAVAARYEQLYRELLAVAAREQDR